MQTLDLTTLFAVCADLRANWLPARLEQVYQRDRFTLALALRTHKGRGWLTICWHPQGAHICIGSPPPRTPDTFTFSDQLRHQLSGLALSTIENISPWERVVDLQFAQRPGEPAVWHLYVEIMGKYSNVILTEANQQIVSVAHQVNANQSSLRTVQTGELYQLPPSLTNNIPNLDESFTLWQSRVSLIPGAINRQLLQTYRGLSPSLVRSLLNEAKINPDQTTETLTESDWQNLFNYWQQWLQALKTYNFTPGWTPSGYTVMGWGITKPSADVQSLINTYYTSQLNQEVFKQLRHQLSQKISNLLVKQRQKANNFKQRLDQSTEADLYRQKADLLMAYLHEWEPGMKSITLADFETGEPVTIALNPEKNAVLNAQSLYKQHQKLKRAKIAVEPLLLEVVTEINYLEQVEASITQLDSDSPAEDLQTLYEIREELIQQGYLESEKRTSNKEQSHPHNYRTPSGFEILIGRNNRQNDQLTFRTANDYDLWFHTQEIPGSHVLLRLEPGAIPDSEDLQFAADLAAYYSRARQSDVVAVVYTQPKYVYKPKGAKPGMAIYKQETVIWGRPQALREKAMPSESKN